MTCMRRMTCQDLFRFNTVNFDQLTETYSFDFYFNYLSKWPQYQVIAHDTNGFAQGYMIGKVEGEAHELHAHVSAVTVAPEARRLGLASQFMDNLEKTAIQVDNTYFVDLFVRKSNDIAIGMYKKLGYNIFRTVTMYYSGPPLHEDGIDMRKALPRDKELKVSSLVCHKDPITPDELEWQ
eukprot:TRINITY_DN20855_c0_g1_i1.p2 TRINITY_DN20855_c0_g1~~TRINITY_DN20855_c0_g1_i1.p2  ORF type:complete len:180 (+),score=55.86 TRINITY_DN20855_c0_g1_i1:78-617(+)